MNKQSLVKEALVVCSPSAGRSAQLAQALDLLKQTKIKVIDTISIKDFDLPEEQVVDWRERGVSLFIAAGGDGLVGSMLPHVLRNQLPLGILPLGTANDVARTVGISMELSQAVEIIADGRLREIDLGLANFLEPGSFVDEMDSGKQVQESSKGQSYLFAHALTIGINVHFARLATDPNIRNRYGTMTYPFAVFEALRSYKPVEIDVTFEKLLMHTSSGTSVLSEEPIGLHCKAAQITVVNAPVFWGTLQALVPGVSLKDRMLDIVVVEDDTVEQLVVKILRFFGSQAERQLQFQSWHEQYLQLLSAQLTDIPGIHHVKAFGVTIKSIGEPHNVTLDGEVCGQAPVYTRVADSRLQLIVPK